MTPRERMQATLDFAGPDRLPVIYHPSEAGLHVHGLKLLELFRRYPPDNPVAFDRLPAPPPDAVDAEGRYYEERTDEWGVRWAHRIFGIGGHAVGHPFETWREGLEAYRLPELPPMDGEAFAAEVAEAAKVRRQYCLIEGWISIFMLLYALRPMDDVLADLLTDRREVMAFVDRLVGFWDGVIDRYLAKGVDAVMFADDWATQSGLLVSPDLFRSAFLPRYREMIGRVKSAGRRAFFHCCGRLDAIFDDLVALGVDGLWIQSGLYDDDAFAERCSRAGVSVYIHLDRQRLIPLGTPEEIRRTVRRFAERYRRLGGGGIFYVEIENDAPWDNVRTLIEAIDAYR